MRPAVIVFGFAGTLAVALSTSVRAAEPETVRPIHFLMMSDVHFDPMADPKLVDRLALAEPEEWQAILESSADKSLGRYGADSNWALLGSALRQAKQVLSNPAFVILPGDFLPHNFRRRFDVDAADHSDAAYRLFVRKTMQFLASQLEQTFPDTPILPALGNDDAVCGNYQLQPGGPFLADTLPILRVFVGALGSPGFDRNWTSYGNYSVMAHGLRIIFPNTVFFSPRYRNACGSSDDADPGSATLAWVETELAAAARGRREPGWCTTSHQGSMASRRCARGRARIRLFQCGNQVTPRHSTRCCGAILTPSSPALPATLTWMISACSSTIMDTLALC